MKWIQIAQVVIEICNILNEKKGHDELVIGDFDRIIAVGKDNGLFNDAVIKRMGSETPAITSILKDASKLFQDL